MKKHIGYIGLGKMGLNMINRLREKSYEISAFDVNVSARDAAKAIGAKPFSSLELLVQEIPTPRLIWIMVPHTTVHETIEAIKPYLTEGDVLIDGGNSLYKESIHRAQTLNLEGIAYIDVGVSGGPEGAKNGSCLMIGGDEQTFKTYESLFKDIAADQAYTRVGTSGSGHFVKMVHNAIEYGMMQSIAEGFTVLKQSEFNLDIEQVANLYNHQSVIESRLIEWLASGLKTYGKNLDEISGKVSHTGEAEWAIQAARELGVPTPIIQQSLEFRKQSEKNPSFTGKILSTLRNQFGGHSVK